MSYLNILLIIHVAICVFLIAIILLQQGKGADVGATFGGGGNTLFGAAGADNLLTKVTAFAAGGFMLTSIFLAIGQKPGLVRGGTIFEGLPSQAPAPLSKVVQPSTSPAEKVNAGNVESKPTSSNSTQTNSNPTSATPAPTPPNAVQSNAGQAANVRSKNLVETKPGQEAEGKIMKPEQTSAPVSLKPGLSEKSAKVVVENPREVIIPSDLAPEVKDLSSTAGGSSAKVVEALKNAVEEGNSPSN